jgi:dipeptidyl aminopeptidase/acylaminoacyl peptidase
MSTIKVVIQFAMIMIVAGLMGCARQSPPKPQVSLAEFRKTFHTKLTRQTHEKDDVEDPPPELFESVTYKSPAGKLAAYVSVPPKGPEKHPAIIWIVGGFSNSIGSNAWIDGKPEDDQSATAYRKAGLVMMYPSLRGGNSNPGFKECECGEVEDVLAAADYLASLPYVDSTRIYLGGHSTGGTLALLAAESSNRFRAVFSFGPVDDIRGYGSDDAPFDLDDLQEVLIRSPEYWLQCVQTPTFVFEGDMPDSNISCLRNLERQSTNPALHFFAIRDATHFTGLYPMSKLVAARIMADSKPQMNISFTQAELDGVMSGK